MFLSRIIYYSRASGEADVDAILTAARSHNQHNHVTGALWFDGDFFVQALEGGRSEISAVYNRIVQDSRHRDIVLVDCAAIDERRFADWDMAFFRETRKNREQIKRYCAQDFLDPGAMPAASLLNLLEHGSAMQQPVSEGHLRSVQL